MTATPNRFNKGTVVFHIKHKRFGIMKTGYPKKPSSTANRKKGEIRYDIYEERHQEDDRNSIILDDRKYDSQLIGWFLSNLIIVKDPKHRLAIQLKYGT